MVSRETLRSYQLFAGQSIYMLDEIARISNEVVLEEGEWLFHEREDAARLYLIMDGAVSLCLNLFLNGSSQHVEATSPLGRGELVGWSAIVRPHVYTLGARTFHRSRLLVIEAEPLRQLLDDNPHYGYFLMKNMAEVMGDRLTSKCVQLLSMVLDSEGAPITPAAVR